MAYDLNDIRTRVRAKIKDSSYSASNIDGFIDDAQMEIADLYPWQFFQKAVTGTLTVGDYTYELQDDHQTTERLIILHPTDNSYRNITNNFLPADEFYIRFPAPDTQTNGQPLFWTEFGDQRYFNCPAGLEYRLRTYYRKIPTELSTDAQVPELPRNFREALVLGAAYRCEEERDNYDIAAVLQNRFNDKVSDLMTRLANTTTAGPDTVIGGFQMEDDWRN
tara:strand:- start:655 stop:1317 length:663 start_codon:yes stop_codon:yes gene_type:complete